MKKIKGNSPENYIFIPGTIAYGIFLGKKDKKETCKVCKGKTEIKLNDGKTYTCPACSGIGHHFIHTPWEWILDSYPGREITSISIRNKEVIYFFGCNGFKAENVFATKAEAQKEIQRRNKILRSKEEMEKELDEQNE